MKSKIKNKGKVFIGLSGGVDSSVSAALLKKEGYDVTGVFILGWVPDFMPCSQKEDRIDAMRVCAKLEIPFITLDLEKEYKKEVVDYMIREYKAGRTPNPDVMCNKHIKFGAFFDWAIANGADFVATGHYARISSPPPLRRGEVPSLRGGGELKRTPPPPIPYRNCPLFRPHRFGLKESCRAPSFRPSPPRLRGRGELLVYSDDDMVFEFLTARDVTKDQSYFLWTLTQKQLSRTLFPVGDLIKKTEVRKLAKKFGLPTAEKKDSQGLCFMGKIDVKEFLKNFIKPKKGDVLNELGEKIGGHDGAFMFTIGERHNFIITKKGANDLPYYVIAKDILKNTIRVSHKSPEGELALTSREAVIGNVSWTAGEPDFSKKYQTRIRYRQPLQSCKLFSSALVGVKSASVRVLFDTPQNAITPGQSLVLYDGEACVGGGIIR